jgi:hypothetical protein
LSPALVVTVVVSSVEAFLSNTRALEVPWDVDPPDVVPPDPVEPDEHPATPAADSTAPPAMPLRTVLRSTESSFVVTARLLRPAFRAESEVERPSTGAVRLATNGRRIAAVSSVDAGHQGTWILPWRAIHRSAAR